MGYYDYLEFILTHTTISHEQAKRIANTSYIKGLNKYEVVMNINNKGGGYYEV